MTLKEAREFINLLLITNVTVALVMICLVIVFLIVIVGLAGQIDLTSCLEGAC